MVLGTVKGKAGPCELWPEPLKTMLSSRGAIRLESIKSDGSRNGQAGRQSIFSFNVIQFCQVIPVNLEQMIFLNQQRRVGQRQHSRSKL